MSFHFLRPTFFYFGLSFLPIGFVCSWLTFPWNIQVSKQSALAGTHHVLVVLWTVSIPLVAPRMSEVLSSLSGHFWPSRKGKWRMELQPVESLISCCLNFPLRRQPSPVSRIHSSSPPSLYKRQALTRPDLFLQPLLQAPLPPWCLVSLVPHLSGGYSCEIYSPKTQRIESSSGQK